MSRLPRNHFICLPLWSQANLSLQANVASFQTSIRQLRPSGFDESILITPARLHLTIGTLAVQNERNGFGPTIDEALQLLESCRDQVLELTSRQPVRMSFDSMASFQERLDNCHVLYGVPVDESGVLAAVCGTSI